MASRLHGLAVPLTLLLLLLLTACGPRDGTRQPAEQPTATAAPEPTATPDPALQPVMQAAQPDSTQLTDSNSRAVARHVLVAHEAAANKPMHVHRGRGAAQRRAEKLRERLQAGEDFATLAKKESDCASAPRGGFLGGFGPGVMSPAFERATFALPVGGMSRVVETPFGFHVILREPLEEVHLAQILVQFEGATGVHFGPAASRTREEARDLAWQAYHRLEQGEAFASLANELSDGAAGLRGGDLGWFTRGQFLPAWEQIAFALEPDQTTEPFETPVGFHVLRRVE